jgi:hypothetical protein
LCVLISLWVIWLAFVELFLLGLVEDRIIEVGVSSYKLYEDSWNYSRVRCLGIIPTLKVCVLV